MILFLDIVDSLHIHLTHISVQGAEQVVFASEAKIDNANNFIICTK